MKSAGEGRHIPVFETILIGAAFASATTQLVFDTAEQLDSQRPGSEAIGAFAVAVLHDASVSAKATDLKFSYTSGINDGVGILIAKNDCRYGNRQVSRQIRVVFDDNEASLASEKALRRNVTGINFITTDPTHSPEDHHVMMAQDGHGWALLDLEGTKEPSLYGRERAFPFHFTENHVPITPLSDEQVVNAVVPELRDGYGKFVGPAC